MWQLATRNWQMAQGKIARAFVFCRHSALALAGLIANCYLQIRRPLFFVLLLLSLNQSRFTYSQDTQDIQPQIEPRRDPPSSPPHRQHPPRQTPPPAPPPPTPPLPRPVHPPI